MDLPEEIELELDRARTAETEGNHGKARVCARRAVGRAFMLSGYSAGLPASASAVQCLKAVSESDEFSRDARDAARRLLAGVTENGGSSVSLKPIEDAVIVITRLLAK